MNIKNFKDGDLVTRNEAMTYKHNESADGSYTGDKLVFRGVDEESKIIFLERTDNLFEDKLLDLSYARDRWDEGWCLYPESLYQKIKAKIKSL